MVVIVMGVVGAGKTTIGRLLAEQLAWQFADADDFHSSSSVEKIRHGIALTDADREPWIEALRSKVAEWVSEKRNAVLACSALKQSYRDRLQVGTEVHFVYLKGTPELIAQRLSARHGHFADAQILASQFGDLEEPETALVVDVADSPARIVTIIRERLGLA
jgi:gluconokinase